MRTLFRHGLVIATLLLSGAAWADATVKFVQPKDYSDMPFSEQDRGRVMKTLDEHLQKLAKKLPAGQTLTIDVLNIDLAGRIAPNRRSSGDDIRLLTGGADWPHMRLRYVLEANGQMINSGESELSDMSYLNRLNRYPSGASLRYEKQMLDDWFAKTFLPKTAK